MTIPAVTIGDLSNKGSEVNRIGPYRSRWNQTAFATVDGQLYMSKFLLSSWEASGSKRLFQWKHPLVIIPGDPTTTPCGDTWDDARSWIDSDVWSDNCCAPRWVMDTKWSMTDTWEMDCGTDITHWNMAENWYMDSTWTFST